MTYLFKNDTPFDGEIKNDTGNPLPISKDTSANSAENPIHVEVTNPVSSVEVTSMPEVEIKNDAGNPIIVSQGTIPWIITPDNNVSIDNAPWELLVGMGKVAGVTGLSISGFSSSVGVTYVPAWEDGEYVYFASAQVVRVWSESASDTNVSVLISGLDANYVQQTETVVLTNGITGVLSTKQFLRVNNISLTRTPQNVGKIHVGSSDKTITLAYIGIVTNISAGRSQMTVYTVPAGYTFFLTQSNWYTNQTGSQTALYRSYTKTPSGLVSVVLTFPMQQQYNSVKVVPRAYAEKTDIQWQVASSSGTSNVGGQIEGYLISNSLLT